MTKAEFVRYCAKQAGFTQTAMLAALDTILDSIVDLVSVGESVHINDFGEFYLKDASARVARNVYTGEQIEVPAKLKPAFVFGKGFKLAVDEMQNSGRKELAE